MQNDVDVFVGPGGIFRRVLLIFVANEPRMSIGWIYGSIRSFMHILMME